MMYSSSTCRPQILQSYLIGDFHNISTRTSRAVMIQLTPTALSVFQRLPNSSLSAVALIVFQPQVQLVQLGAEQGVHVLDAEGRFVFREGFSSRPGRGRACFSDSNERLLRLPRSTDLQELQKPFDAPRAAPGLRAVLAVERHLEYGLQAAFWGFIEILIGINFFQTELLLLHPDGFRQTHGCQVSLRLW